MTARCEGDKLLVSWRYVAQSGVVDAPSAGETSTTTTTTMSVDADEQKRQWLTRNDWLGIYVVDEQSAAANVGDVDGGVRVLLQPSDNTRYVDAMYLVASSDVCWCVAPPALADTRKHTRSVVAASIDRKRPVSTKCATSRAIDDIIACRARESTFQSEILDRKTMIVLVFLLLSTCVYGAVVIRFVGLLFVRVG